MCAASNPKSELSSRTPNPQKAHRCPQAETTAERKLGIAPVASGGGLEINARLAGNALVQGIGKVRGEDRVGQFTDGFLLGLQLFVDLVRESTAN
jgi:hypothetical protein